VYQALAVEKTAKVHVADEVNVLWFHDVTTAQLLVLEQWMCRSCYKYFPNVFIMWVC